MGFFSHCLYTIVRILEQYNLTYITFIKAVGFDVVFTTERLEIKHDEDVIKAGEYYMIFKNDINDKQKRLLNEAAERISKINIPSVHERDDVLTVLEGLDRLLQKGKISISYDYYCSFDDKVCSISSGCVCDSCTCHNLSCKQISYSNEIHLEKVCKTHSEDLLPDPLDNQDMIRLIKNTREVISKKSAYF